MIHPLLYRADCHAFFVANVPLSLSKATKCFRIMRLWRVWVYTLFTPYIEICAYLCAILVFYMFELVNQILEKKYRTNCQHQPPLEVEEADTAERRMISLPRGTSRSRRRRPLDRAALSAAGPAALRTSEANDVQVMLFHLTAFLQQQLILQTFPVHVPGAGQNQLRR